VRLPGYRNEFPGPVVVMTRLSFEVEFWDDFFHFNLRIVLSLPSKILNLPTSSALGLASMLRTAM
jgi:hypothetical protein